MTRETITLTQQEQQRAQVLTQVQHGLLSMLQAAPLLGLSVRHARRLLAAVRQRGLAALAHGNRGHPSAGRLADAIRTQVVRLARTTYAGLNDYHLTDLLHERHGLRLSRPTVYRLLRTARVPRPRVRRTPRHRQRRERMAQAGMLVQLDGSQHAWLGARGPQCVLLAAIDDATGRLLAAVFRPHEDAHGYFLLLRALVRRHGVPVAVYTDRHGLFHRDRRQPWTLPEQLRGEAAPTQIGRALHELGIRWIPAASPQAKGRIERLFGTLQDRLVHELRLAQITTLEDAQRLLRTFLPRYNARFARKPGQPQPAFRPAPALATLETICCFKYRRTVAHDNTVRLEEHLIQLLPGPTRRPCAQTRVDVHERLDGSLAVYYQRRRLASRLLTASPPMPAHGLRARQRPLSAQPRVAASRPPVQPLPRRQASTGPWVPPKDHPWRRMIARDIWRHQHRPKRTFSLNC
jgi:transposase